MECRGLYLPFSQEKKKKDWCKQETIDVKYLSNLKTNFSSHSFSYKSLWNVISLSLSSFKNNLTIIIRESINPQLNKRVEKFEPELLYQNYDKN